MRIIRRLCHIIFGGFPFKYFIPLFISDRIDRSRARRFIKNMFRYPIVYESRPLIWADFLAVPFLMSVRGQYEWGFIPIWLTIKYHDFLYDRQKRVGPE